MKKILILLFLVAKLYAETPPSPFTTIKGGTDGTKIGNVSDALKVTGTSTISGTVGVTQSTSPWIISGNTGRTWTLLNTTDSVNVGNFPSVFGVTQSTSPWVVSGTVGATQSGSWATGRTWNLINSTDSVNVGNFPGTQAVTQGTTPWIVSSSVSGLSKVNLIRNVYSSTNVTTGAYVQLLASTADIVNQINIFDSSGQTLVLAVGASGSEVDQIYITPGGNGTMNLGIPVASRISVKAVSATANVGELDISLLK